MKKLMTVKQYAKSVDADPRTVRRWVKCRLLKVTLPGKGSHSAKLIDSSQPRPKPRRKRTSTNSTDKQRQADAAAVQQVNAKADAAVRRAQQRESEAHQREVEAERLVRQAERLVTHAEQREAKAGQREAEADVIIRRDEEEAKRKADAEFF